MEQRKAEDRYKTYGYNALEGFCNPELLHIWLFKVIPHCSGNKHYSHDKRR